MEILIAEDEKQIATSLKKNFLEEGHHAVIALDGVQALHFTEEIQFDVILLDWKMPNLSGIEVCKQLREKGNKTPIILLTALTDISNKVEALNLGADDYITKPFSFEEILARIKAVIRRYNISTDVLKFSDLQLNLIERTVENSRAQTVHLTDKEADLLKTLIKNKGMILSKEDLCKNVWNLNFTPQTNICEVTVKNLRKKLEDVTDKNLIKTIYGEGYTLIGD